MIHTSRQLKDLIRSLAKETGMEARATMDIDTTIRRLPVTKEYMTQVIREICDVNLDDNVAFQIKSVSEIMDEAEYSGLRFAMEAYLDGSVTPLSYSWNDVMRSVRKLSHDAGLLTEKPFLL